MPRQSDVLIRMLENKISAQMLKPRMRKFVNKDQIPRNFRKFFLYVCQKAGIVEQGRPQYPEYLDHLASIIIHKDLETNNKLEGQNVVFSTPPRHLKTTMIIAGLLYVCIFYKRKKSMYSSYSDDITKEASDLFEKMAQAIGYGKVGNKGKRVIGSNTVLFKSLKGGGTTGRGSNFTTVVDDCLKNQTDAFSPIVRKQILESFQSALITRSESERVNMIIIGTRFHEDDLLGYCINHLHYKPFIYPAITNNKPLFPELRSLEFLQKTQREVGDYVWRTLYMCDPPSETQGLLLFKRSFHKISELPPNEQIVRISCGIDLAYKEAEDGEGDLAAYVKLGITNNNNIVILDSYANQILPQDFFEIIKERNQTSLPLYWYVSSIERAFKREIESAYRVTLKPQLSLGKRANAMPVSIYWNQGKIFVPNDWDMKTIADNHLLKQIIDFQGKKSDKDDCIDALAAAFDNLIPRKTTSRLPMMEVFDIRLNTKENVI